MIEETDFETFLYISKNKYQIFVYDKYNLKNLYESQLKINDDIDLNFLSKFLDENIYKIEKIVSNFIRDIILIIEDDKIFNTNISIKKKNYKKHIEQKYDAFAFLAFCPRWEIHRVFERVVEDEGFSRLPPKFCPTYI